MAAHAIANIHAMVLLCLFSVTVLLHINSSRQSILTLYAKTKSLKLVHYCTLLFMAHHFECVIRTLRHIS